MGYTIHHAIIVTSFDLAKIKIAHEKAQELFSSLTPPVASPVNSWHSFLIPPDGSKEGWDDSDQGDDARDAFISWLKQQCYSDGSSPFEWVEVQYGRDAGDTWVARDSNEK